MQIDLQTIAIKPLRHASTTSPAVSLGQTATRYPGRHPGRCGRRANYHTSPIFGPWITLIYDRTRTVIKITNWYSFKDRISSTTVPTRWRAKQQDTAEANFDFVGRGHNLPRRVRDTDAAAGCRCVTWPGAQHEQRGSLLPMATARASLAVFPRWTSWASPGITRDRSAAG